MDQKKFNGILSLFNFGNSCYFNCTLQCLMSCRDLQYQIKNYMENQENIGIIFLMDELYKKYDDPMVPMSNPVLLKQILSKYNSFFADNYQQDCHECLISVLDAIHEETKNKKFINRTSNIFIVITDKKLYNISTKNWNNYINNFGNSIVTNIFTGQLRSQLICHQCKKERNNFEIFNNISLSLTKYNSQCDIIDCFFNFFGPEIMDNGNQVQCDHCKQKTKTSKKMSIWRFPKILIIHLKRYTQLSNGTYVRNNCLIDFTSILSFSTNTKTIDYELICVVNHYGSTPLGGHYTSLVKQNSSWVHIDDSDIYTSNVEDLCTTASYILVYSRI